MEYKLLIDKYKLEQDDYDYVEKDKSGFYEFNDVKINNDLTSYRIKDKGFIWFDNYGYLWFMSIINIAKNIHNDRFTIVAVKE